MNKLKLGWIVMLFFIVINGNAQDMITVEQVSREKVFIKMVELLAKNDSFANYLDRTPLSETIKIKLTVSDLKIHPVFKTIQEGNNYIIVPNSELLKTNAQFYLKPLNLVIKKDTSSLEFDMIVKNKPVLHGMFRLIPTKPALDYDDNGNSTQILMFYKKEF